MLRSRATVLTSALALLAERGIAGTTIEAIAEHSGVAKTTIYRQWDSQAALILDAFDSVLALPEDPATGDLRSDLLQLLTGFADALRTSPATGLMFALIDAAERDPAFAALHRRQAETRHRLILDVITRGIEKGELPADADPDELLDLLAGPVFHRRAVSGGRLDAAFAERVVDCVIAAYRTT
ncbi:TetR family transcriptional regulator [Actinoplanes sp. SE50]|uniref:TetR/AcrR family transcriptional regulator n=1 Tax=unclassified Actinoplanes TaxID=2626549 RepID=UPI00023ED43E|nr:MULTISPECIES: TetR/AcrR family transcriptional regulator [unclassified Actinoplanes]AEV84449.1 putative HTH-type transcriptional regulator [Actinoplanes sp. SE50/110]ATO82841.1 TetR family transcriptional regulator [Actinoplanes sp. SE50]SLM00249.1 TetR family transcriptional regulator [Actinoplanes sp. SE50/110]